MEAANFYFLDNSEGAITALGIPPCAAPNAPSAVPAKPPAGFLHVTEDGGIVANAKQVFVLSAT